MDGGWMEDLYKGFMTIFWFAVAAAVLIPVLIGVIVYLIVAN
jgi:hypothetical protein